MRKWLVGACVAALVATVVAAQRPSPTEEDRAAVRQAAYDYAEGYYEGAALRMERAVHPAVVKQALLTESGEEWSLEPMNAETLVELTRQGGGKKRRPDARHIVFTLLDIRADVASAKIFTAGFNDYLHLIKQGGRWRLVNVLWTTPSPTAAANAGSDKAAVARAVKEYYDALTALDAAGVERVIHPEATLRSFRPDADGPPYLRETGREFLLAGVRARTVQPPPPPVITVLDVYENIASVLLTSGSTTSYWHLARQNGQWRLVNRLSR